MLLIIAAWRMRRFPDMAAILLPLCVASLVNSDILSWSFAALAIMLFASSWADPSTKAVRIGRRAYPARV